MALHFENLEWNNNTNEINLTMKSAKIARNYYQEYIEVCKYFSAKSDFKVLNKLLFSKDKIENRFNSPFGSCLIDYSSMKYVYLSEHCDNILSYSREDYIKGGLDFHVKVFHPEDRSVFTEMVFQDIIKFWKSIPFNEFSQYRFSFNH